MWKKIFVFSLVLLLLSTTHVQAEDCDNFTFGSIDNVNCLENRWKATLGQIQTLASMIAYYNSQMALTEAQINQTEAELKKLEEEISLLSVKINRLDENLTNISKLLVSRIGASYKRSLFKPIYMVFATGGLSDFFERNKYLQSVQQNDRVVLLELQNSKDQHEQQKKIEEEKQAQAEALKQKLAVQNSALQKQRQSKQQLLEITKNDERKYQDLLAAARAEMVAIQSIVAGGGQEVSAGEVSQGSKIATIISGRSACSTGTHLHFEVGENGKNINPTNYLKSQEVNWDLCGWWPDCDSPFSFSGSVDWPVNGKPRITQGYGMTAYARSGAYSGGPHTGIDMVSDDLAVKAVKNGMLYKGTVACGGGILRYVKVDHKDSDTATYYLHVNY